LRDLGDEVSCLLQEGGCGARGIDHVVHVSSLNVTNTLLVPALPLLPLQYTHPCRSVYVWFLARPASSFPSYWRVAFTILLILDIIAIFWNW